MAAYKSRPLDLDDDALRVLRLSDAALVGAGLAAVLTGAPVFQPVVLARGGVEPYKPEGVAPEALAPGYRDFVGSASIFSIDAKGKISPVDREGLVPQDALGGLALKLDFEKPGGADQRGDEDSLKKRLLKRRLDLLVGLFRSFLTAGVRIEHAPLLSRTLEFSVPSIHARPVQLPPIPRRDGSGVVVGIADWGCDFAHPAFRHPDGSTRLLYLWDQNPLPPLGGPGIAGPGGVGRLFCSATINAALAKNDPYFALGYNPVHSAYGELPPVHGTHLLSVAAGSAAKGVPPGVAPGADLIFVNLPPNALLTAASRLAFIDAVLWMFHQSNHILGLPTVVNVSLGTNYGPHDGTTNLETILDLAVAHPDRVIVVSAGNAHDDKLHASGAIRPGGELSLTWTFVRGDTTRNTLDIWYETPTLDALLIASLVQPDGTASLVQPDGTTLGPGAPLSVFYGDRLVGVLTATVWNWTAGPPFLQHIHIALEPDQTVSEDWTVRLLLPAGASPGPIAVDAWVNRDDFRFGVKTQSRVQAGEANQLGTLASLSCGRNTICVGAYYEIPRGQPAVYFSSAGPTRDRRPKPDVAAPGYQVVAANALGGQRVDKCGHLDPKGSDVAPLVAAMSGTSVSAAFVSGLAALLLQTQPGATAAQVAAWIKDWTQILPPTSAVPPVGANPPRNWEPQLGFGRIDAAASLWNQP